MAKNTVLLDDDVSNLIRIRLSDDYQKKFKAGRNISGLWEEINFQLGSLYSGEILKNKFTQLISYYNLCRSRGERGWKHYREIDELIGEQKEVERKMFKRINLSDSNIKRVRDLTVDISSSRRIFNDPIDRSKITTTDEIVVNKSTKKDSSIMSRKDKIEKNKQRIEEKNRSRELLNNKIVFDGLPDDEFFNPHQNNNIQDTCIGDTNNLSEKNEFYSLSVKNYNMNKNNNLSDKNENNKVENMNRKAEKKMKEKILIEEMKILKDNLRKAQENLNDFIKKYF